MFRHDHHSSKIKSYEMLGFKIFSLYIPLFHEFEASYKHTWALGVLLRCLPPPPQGPKVNVTG